MSFTLTIRATAPRIAAQIAKPSTIRSFHQSASKQFFNPRTLPRAKPSTPTSLTNTIKRHASYQAYPVGQPPVSRIRKLIVGGAVFGGTLVAINVVFNRETRDGAIPKYEREYLNSTFLHMGLGLGTIAFSARAFLRNGVTYRIMMANPWVVAIGGLAAGIGTMMVTRSIDPDNTVPKYAAWTGFNVVQAAVLSSFAAFYPPAILARAGLATVAMMGSLAIVGATAKEDKYLYIGGPLLAGGAVVLASGLAPLIIPVTAVRTLALTESIWLYGGLAVFGGFTLYDIQKVLYRGRMAERGLIKRDPVSEAISLELDFINLFIRFAQIFAMGGNRRK